MERPVVAVRSARTRTWSVRTLASGTDWSNVAVYAARDGWAFAVSMHRDAADTWTVRVAIRNPDSGTWSPLRSVTDFNPDATDVSVQIGPDGDLLILLKIGSGARIKHVTTAGVVTTEDPGIDPQVPVGPLSLATSGDGTELLVWQANVVGASTYAMRRSPGGAWTAPFLLALGNGSHNRMPLAAGPSGFVIPFISVDGTTRRFEVVFWRPADATPQGPVTLGYSNDPSPAVEMDAGAVAFDVQGNAIATWEVGGRGGGRIHYRYRPAGGAWTAPALVPSPHGGSSTMVLQADAAGNFVGTWTANAGTDQAYTVVGGFDTAAPTITVTMATHARVGARFVAHARARDTWSGLAGAISWDFGDGTHASGRATAHRFLLPGTYPVIVSARDRLGHRRIRTFNVVVTS